MNKTWVAVLVGALVIAGLGFGVNQIVAGENGPALTEKEAAKKAEERYPGTVKEIELDDRGARPVYEIELQGAHGEYEIKMDADTGDILKVEQSRVVDPKAGEGDNPDDPKEGEGVAGQRAQEEKPIGYERAKRIARSQFDGHVVKIQLDEDDGRWIYEVEMKKGKREAEFEIDAHTGEILFMSLENSDDDDD